MNRQKILNLIMILVMAAVFVAPRLQAVQAAPLSQQVPKIWTYTGSMNDARMWFTATLLMDGRVLVAGGSNNYGYLSSAELYDPATGVWSRTGDLSTQRARHTATLLSDGRVLVAAGSGNSAEIYNPATGTWSPTGDMHIGRANHTAVGLLDGRVLVAGGGVSEVEIFDPGTDAWTLTGPLSVARTDNSLTLLQDGRVLIAGGDGGDMASAELYDPATGQWTPTGSMNTGRYLHTATLLNDGRVLVAGGYNIGYLSSAELYNPATEAWSTTGSLNSGRIYMTDTLLPDGSVMVTGGANFYELHTNTEIYDPASGAWSIASPLNRGRQWHAATLLSDGRVLAAGGYNGGWALSDAEIYGPAAAPTNDNFADAKLVVNMPFQDTVNNAAATTETGEPVSSCSSSSSISYNTFWYAYTPAENGRLDGNVSSSFDSYLSVYTESSLGGLSELTCSLSGSSLQINVTQGTTYYFQIGSRFDGSFGNVSLNFTQPPTNDNFADAKVVTATPYQDTVDSTYATGEPGEPAGCGYYGASRTIWYAFTPISKGILTGNESSYSYNYSFITVYTGNSLDSLSQITCATYGSTFQVSVSPGTTYYIQIGSLYNYSFGSYTLNLSFTPAPPNDDFADAMVIGSLPFSRTVNSVTATTEDGEPNPSCVSYGVYHTIWYAYTPSASGSFTFQKNGFYDIFMAIYTGSSLDTLTPLRCVVSWPNLFTLPLEAGVTYYIQLGEVYEGFYNDLTLDLYVPPPPSASFFWSPADPSRFDNMPFCDGSSDPGVAGFNHFWWNFGDGAQQETSDGCVYHQYAADGDYSVWHKVQTSDGRTGETSMTISVRTHDVAITRFSVPQSASVGQTRPITVGIRNGNYPETVTVELYKSTPYGFTWVDTLTLSVPVRLANRTTDFKFNYTFTNDDGKLGKVTFQAMVWLNGARDALEGDNTAISLPTKVTGQKP